MKKEIIIDFSKNDMQEIEKIPGFTPIWTYPILEKINPRTWGYLINGENIYHFRVKNQEECIKEFVEGFYQMRLRLSGVKNLVTLGIMDLKSISSEMKPLIDLCETMIHLYSDKKTDKDQS